MHKVTKLRRQYKAKAVAILGGRCSRCGYDRCLGALQFHHVNRDEKSFGISKSGFTRAWCAIEKELKKCILLCANCHAEVEESLFMTSSNVERPPVKGKVLGSSPRS